MGRLAGTVPLGVEHRPDGRSSAEAGDRRHVTRVLARVTP